MKTITATITKIDPLKASRNGVNSYIRVYLQEKEGGFYWTDLCPDYRNYANWKPHLQVGNILGNLRLRDDKSVNADSYPVRLNKGLLDT